MREVTINTYSIITVYTIILSAFLLTWVVLVREAINGKTKAGRKYLPCTPWIIGDVVGVQ